ncbi:unnamed protein product [Schistosoma rodhaini]|uniref:Tyrosine-protein kinase ephrin type A/B receptor-like domain-containing protein n=1 Tax=Schistosoma rodhaini TaxID=6188 RepID=A0AA85FYS5_9TREM|nr:unnamed protein product [Schistosoma rodhaini]
MKLSEIYLFLILLSGVEFFNAQQVSTHTLWIPSGKILYLPCWLNQIQEGNINDWLEVNKQLKERSLPNTITVWFNKGGEIIHVGEVLTIYLPLTGVSKVPILQNALKKEGIPGVKMNLEPKYSETLAGIKQHLFTHEMEIVTCAAIRSTPIIGVENKWAFFERDSRIVRQAQFASHVYTPPIIVWSYALEALSKDIITEKNLTQTLTDIKHWCASKVNIDEYKSSPCQDIVVQVMPLISLKKPTDSLPVELPKSTFTEISIPIELSHEPIYLLLSPSGSHFNYIHATLKAEMDELIKRSVVKDNLFTREITTGIRVVCPPGSQTYQPPPLLKSITPGELNKSLFRNSSAYPLTKWSVVCHPCPPGHAPQTPYAFSGCHLCPKGYYSGETNYPSSGGCLQCPIGFTTDNIGAKSVRECHVDGGVISRLIIGIFINVWKEFEQFLIGNLRKEFTTRAVEQIQETDWVWKKNIGLSVWIFLSLYILTAIWLSSIAVYRMHLYIKLRRMYQAQFRLLLKSALVGQINVVLQTKRKIRTSNVT